MLNFLWASDSQDSEDFRKELSTSTTRRLGGKLRYEFQSSSRRRNGIQEELSRRIRLMEKIPGSHPSEIFVYNNKGFKSFTSKVKDILGRDLERKPQKVAVPKYLDYTRGMLKDEIEKGKKAQPILKEGAKGQEEGDDQLKEDYEQLVEEFGAMEAEHEQLIEKYKQLKKDHIQLQKEHERVLHELDGRKEMQAKAHEQKTASAPPLRPCDEGIKQPPVLGGKILLPELSKQGREAPKAHEERERGSAQAREIEAREKEAREKEAHEKKAREKEARDQHETKIREWEDENFVQQMNQREEELRRERAAREQQRRQAPPKDIPAKERLDVKTGAAGQQLPRHSIHGGVADSQLPSQTRNQTELFLGQKTGYPNMQQGVPDQLKPVPLRQANDSMSVSSGLPNTTPNMNQEPSAKQKSDPLQQTDVPKSVSAGFPTGTPIMDQIFPAQQPPVQQPPVQQRPVQQRPVQQLPVHQRSARLQENDPRSFQYGLPTGTPDMGHLFPTQQKSAPLRQTDESKKVSFHLPSMTAPTPTGLGVSALSRQSGPQLNVPMGNQEPVRSQVPRRNTTSDRTGMAEIIDRSTFIRRPDGL